MVNVIIYLTKEHDPPELTEYLFSEKLIASTSIDENKVNQNSIEEDLIKPGSKNNHLQKELFK
jgi:hypothetical protein